MKNLLGRIKFLIRRFKNLVDRVFRLNAYSADVQAAWSAEIAERKAREEVELAEAWEVLGEHNREKIWNDHFDR